MTEPDSNTAPDATPSSHLGFRIAVGVAGLALLAMFIMLGSVAMKQSATQQSLEARGSLQDSTPSEPARE